MYIVTYYTNFHVRYNEFLFSYLHEKLVPQY